MTRVIGCGLGVAAAGRRLRSGMAWLLIAPLMLGLAGCDAPKMAKAPPKDEKQATAEYRSGPDDREFKPGQGAKQKQGGGSSGRWDGAEMPPDDSVDKRLVEPPSPAPANDEPVEAMPPPPAGGSAAPAPAPRTADAKDAAKPYARSRSYGAPRPPSAAAPTPAPAPAPVGGAPEAKPTPPQPDAGVTKPGTAVVDEKSDWDVVPVFFGTDRARMSDPKRIAYGSDRGRKLELGRALITVPKAHEVPNIERPWAIKVPYFDVKIYEQAEDPKKHFTMKEIQSLTRDQFLAFVKERLATSARYKDHAVIFVHGYNTAFDAAIYRTAQMAYDLKFDGAPFLYSWPSGGTFESYTYDRESAGQSQPFMRDFLDLVVKETGAKSVSIIAHSMGNQPVLQILRDLKYSKPAGVVISQIILAAPDVDRDNFENIAKEIKGMANGVTLYAASNDRALSVSRRFNGGIPRAGDVPATGPMILSGIDTIDVTAAGMDGLYLNHSSYAENNALLADIGLIIQTGERPPDKRFPILQKMKTDHGDYWKYPPKR
ncbi:MAG: alpha/beta hydrolase [Hyphomicrobiaceae bacterium]|nr:alpha/beta hydrolase [Hyphomicrobiaceae bacterium]